MKNLFLCVSALACFVASSSVSEAAVYVRPAYPVYRPVVVHPYAPPVVRPAYPYYYHRPYVRPHHGRPYRPPVRPHHGHHGHHGRR